MDKLFPAFEENNIAIALAADDNYVPCSAVMIRSILKNGSQTNNYDIVFLHNGITQENERMLLETAAPFPNASLRLVNAARRMGEYSFYTGVGEDKTRMTQVAYYRLLIPELMEAYEKVLYLDGDAAALTDVAEVYRTDLGDCLLAACRDLYAMMNYYDPKEDLKAYWDKELELEDPDSYFLSGMLLFNIPLFHKEYPTEEILRFAASRQWRQHDQDALNVLCKGRVKLLSSDWEVIESGTLRPLPPHLQAEFDKSVAEPKIVQFAGGYEKKPWRNIDAPYGEHFWRYAADTPFSQQLIRTLAYSERAGDARAREAMEDQFRQGKAGLKYLLKLFRLWLNYKRKKTT